MGAVREAAEKEATQEGAKAVAAQGAMMVAEALVRPMVAEGRGVGVAVVAGLRVPLVEVEAAEAMGLERVRVEASQVWVVVAMATRTEMLVVAE